MKLAYFHTTLKTLIIGISITSTPWLYAQAQSYSELLERVIRNQPQQVLLQGVQGLHQAHAEASSTWLAGDINLQIAHENSAGLDRQNQRNWQVGAEFPIWLPEQKQAQANLSRNYDEQLPTLQRYYQWLASARLRQLVWDFREAWIEKQIAEDALLQSQELFTKVTKKVSAGESPQIDALLAEKEILQQQRELNQKKHQLTLVQQQMYIWTEQYDLPFNMWEEVQSVSLEQQHPYLLHLNKQYQLEESQLAALRSFKRESPRLFLGAKNETGPEGSDNSLMFEVSLPLGHSSTFSTQLAQQRQSLYQSEAELELAHIEINQQIFTAQQTLKATQEKIKLTQQQYEISRKALSMSKQSYQLGETNIQNLLLVQQQSLASKRLQQLAKAQHGRAIAELNQAMGYSLSEPLAEQRGE